jgi:hypothetical protein
MPSGPPPSLNTTSGKSLCTYDLLLLYQKNWQRDFREVKFLEDDNDGFIGSVMSASATVPSCDSPLDPARQEERI